MGEHRILFQRLLIGCCFALAIGWSVHALPARAETHAAARPAQSDEIRQIYLSDCATCHGADARGTDLGPDLHGSGAALVYYYVSTGRMPLSSPDAEVRRHPPKYPPAIQRQLINYTVDLAGGDGPPIPHIDLQAGNLAEGGTQYRLNCAACHAWSGDGGALLHREAPPVHPATPRQVGAAVRGGPGNMPRFGNAALTNEQLNSLVRYVRYLDDPQDRGGWSLWHIGPLVEGAVAVFIGLGALVLVVRWIGTRT